MSYTPEQVVSYGFPFDDFIITYSLAAATVIADVGKALTLDTSATNTMKLAENGDAIHGRLNTFEDREVSGIKVGAVARKFKEKLKAISGHGLAIGNAVVGSNTTGEVRKAVSGADPITNLVIEIFADDYVVVESL